MIKNTKKKKKKKSVSANDFKLHNVFSLFLRRLQRTIYAEFKQKKKKKAKKKKKKKKKDWVRSDDKPIKF